MTYTSLLRRISAVAALTALLAAPAFGQGKWWLADQYIKELGLTAEQSKRLEEIFQNAVPTLKAQKRTLDKAEAEFEALIERGSDAAVMEQVNHLETARAELNKTRTMMLLRMKKVLTTDQWAKFTALHQAQQRAASRPQEAEQK